MKRLNRALVLCAVFLLAAGTAFAGAKGQAGGAAVRDDYPNRPIRMLLPVAPGGGMDTTARQWQKYFEKEIGVPIVIESLPGAGTLIGNRAVAQAEGDGYTLGLFSTSDFLFTILTMDAPYKIADYYWIGGYYSDIAMIWVHKDSPWNNLKEFTDWVKTQPAGTVPFSVSTQTSPDFINAKNLEKAAGIQLNIVAFTGGNPARLAVASKEVAATVTGLANGQMIADSCKIIGCVDINNPHLGRTNNAKTIKETYGVDVTAPYSFYGMYAPRSFAEKYPQRAEFIANAFKNTINNTDYFNDLKAQDREFTIDYRDPKNTEQKMNETLQVLRQFTDYFK